MWHRRLQQYCVLHQILEFHRIIESQLSQIRELEAWLFSFGVADTPAEEVADDTLSHGTKELAQRVDRLYEVSRACIWLDESRYRGPR